MGSSPTSTRTEGSPLQAVGAPAPNPDHPTAPSEPCTPASDADDAIWTIAEVEEAAPSRQELLERAAELGPARPTWASIALPSDPILGQKMQPRVAARRARFRKIVKATLGVCVAFCFVATAATALSSTSDTRSAPEAAVRLAPASAVVPLETLDQVARTKVTRFTDTRHSSKVIATRWTKRAKHR